MAKSRAPSKHSRAARRATSPSINTDKSLKNVDLPGTGADTDGRSGKPQIPRPSVLAARHAAGVSKKTKRGRQPSARAKRRAEKGLEMAEAVAERTSKKVEKSKGRSRAVQARSKGWDDINRDAEAVKVLGDGEGEREEEWESEEGGEEDEGRTAVVFKPATLGVVPPPVDDDDDVIL